ncbi:MAG: hypothetical protein IKX88_05275, partial [Thermoguttaceae bacterium]|nr:hypothetical protein [Thermoguttaceae bacterium]
MIVVERTLESLRIQKRVGALVAFVAFCVVAFALSSSSARAQDDLFNFDEGEPAAAAPAEP